MDQVLKRRLIGATVLIALAVIFLPMLLVGPEPEALRGQDDFALPAQPEPVREVRRIPLDPAAARVADPAAERPRSDRGETVDSDASAVPPTTPPERTPPDLSSPPVIAPPAEDDATVTAEAPASEPVEAPGDEIVLRPELQPEPEPARQAPEAPAAKAPPTATRDGRWVVQVASFGSANSADQVQQRLDALGHPVLRDELVRGDAVLYRLRTGPYASEQQADTALAQIRATVSGVEPVVREVESVEGSADAAPSGFAVQVGSFANAENAENETARLKGLGFDAFRFSEAVSGREIWRVVVGPAASRAEAETLLARLDREAGVAGLVVSLP
ncbi:MAG: SPOR domain-containing protein [Wenzhouxiangellaceae bacterium]|nr:SPOR domain-containing protein [Wenzhouxiangellaceae bacterium]